MLLPTGVRISLYILWDLTTTDTDGDNKTFCKGTYQPLDLDPNEFAGFDLALGDAFLRSVYAS